jgi:hypothetical protein
MIDKERHTRCKVEGCTGVGHLNKNTGKHYFPRGLCNKHYIMWRKHGDPLYARIIHTKCSIEGCNGSGHKNSRTGTECFENGYCAKHNWNFKQHGDPLWTKEETRSKCSIEGCNGVGSLNKETGKRYFPHGYCIKHNTRFKKYGDPNICYCNREGRGKHPLYGAYCTMKERCYNPHNKKYKDYGGRGVVVCDRWLGFYGFNNFVSDMGEKPDPRYSIDRIDVDGNYEPSNCRWASPHQQRKNQRVISEHYGVTFSDYKNAKNPWNVSFQFNNEVIRKSFPTLEEALACRKSLELKFGVIL